VLFEAPLRGVRDRMLALRSMPNYAGLREESLLFIAEHARERRFRAGEQLLEEGVPVTHVYFLVKGKVQLGNRVLTAPGAAGVMSALANDPKGRRGVAVDDVLALEIPVAAFLSNLEEDFAIMRNALRIMASIALDARGNLPVSPSRAGPAETGPAPDHEPTVCERIIALRTHGLFATANMDAVIEIARRMQTRTFEAGALLFDLDEPSNCSLRINYGRVRCTARSGEFVDVGHTMVIGALDAWAGRPRSYAARAETRVIASVTPIEDFLAVVEMHPQLALGMLQNIAASLLAGS
jgi:CRP-like cAMP-binding protein